LLIDQLIQVANSYQFQYSTQSQANCGDKTTRAVASLDALRLYAERMSNYYSPQPAHGERLNWLQTFVRIVETGSLSAAAQLLGTSQPTVSRRLRALEQSLGLALIQRTTHALNLTADGERCYERARQLLSDWDAFDAALRGDQAEPEGLLRVVAPHAFGQEKLVPLLADFLARHPRVQVEWLLRDEMPDFVAQGIDCAIHVGQVDDPGLVAIKLAEVPRIVAVAPSLLTQQPPPSRPAELSELPWLALQTYYRRELVLTHQTSGERARVGITPRLSTVSLYAMRTAAVLGVGACLGSSWLLKDCIAQGQLVQLLPDWQAAPLPVYLVYPYAHFYPARLRRFIEALRERTAAAIAA
jgi:DNA-binding transcriptional LysR family regulator